MQTRIARLLAFFVAGGAVWALAGAEASQAATLYACVKKNGSAHLYAKKPHCRKGEKRLSWNTVGPAGAKGAPGTPGAKGTSGTNGTNGADLTSHTPLPSGQSESGWFAIGNGGTTGGGEMGEGISFSQPLSAGLTENHAIFNGKGVTSPHCPGLGRADRGFLCLYTAEIVGMVFERTLNFNGLGYSFENDATGPYGFALYFSVSGSGGYVDGSWTVTAP